MRHMDHKIITRAEFARGAVVVAAATAIAALALYNNKAKLGTVVVPVVKLGQATYRQDLVSAKHIEWKTPTSIRRNGVVVTASALNPS